MTDKVVEAAAIQAVAIAISKVRLIRHDSEKQFVAGLWAHSVQEAEAAITAYLKALKEEGKHVMSERDIQNLLDNRKIYEG